MSLYLDEDVSTLVADLLRARGFSAITTLEAGQLGNTDIAQLNHAVSNGKVLLTHNRADFEALSRDYFESGRKHFGIIIAVRHSPQEIVRRLLAILNSEAKDEIENQLRYV